MGRGGIRAGNDETRRPEFYLPRSINVVRPRFECLLLQDRGRVDIKGNSLKTRDVSDGDYTVNYGVRFEHIEQVYRVYGKSGLDLASFPGPLSRAW